MNRAVELLRLIAICDRIEGRKKLQKIVHILREAGHPFTYRYGYHFHGPFSAELKGEIDSLVAESIIDEREGETFSGDFKQYAYTLSNSGRSIIDSFGGRESPPWAVLACELNEKPAQELEAISTLVYLVRSGCTDAQIQQRFDQLKPHLAGYFDAALPFALQVIGKRSLQQA